MPFNPKSIDLFLEGANLTQIELSEKTGISQPRISLMRKGGYQNPTIKTLDRLYKAAEEYGLPIEFYSKPK